MPSPSVLEVQPTRLFDRIGELETIRERLTSDNVRLLTLSGPPGVGKTRLALEAGTQLAGNFPDGVILVDLSPARDPNRVLPAIARMVDVDEENNRPLLDRLEENLRNRAPLLILDNFERVLPAASQLAELLATCPTVTLLVTSRVSLHLRWEQTLRISPLETPDLSALPSLDELSHIPSIACFLDRAQALSPTFTLTEDNARSVAELCVHLDGLPLAIELAAARTSLLSPQMLVERLQRRLSLLRWEAHDVPERQHSLGSAIGWSYDLLGQEEQALFRRLGVFVGGFDLEAAEVVVAGTGDGTIEVLETLGSLIDKSLIQVSGQSEERVRYTLLESIREYAWEQLEAHGEVDAAAGAHAEHFLALADQADSHLRLHDQRTWYLRLDQEHDNLRVALRWLLDHSSADPSSREAALHLAAALGYFWILRGYHAEGRQWLEEALRTSADADPAIRTRALLSAGLLLTHGGDFDRSRVILEEALALAQQRQDRSDIARALTRLGACAVLGGKWRQGIGPLQEALRRWEELGDQFEIGATLFYQGSAAFMQGDYKQAATLYSDALRRYEAIGNERGSGAVGLFLSLALLQLGDRARAIHLVQAGIRMGTSLQDRWNLSLGTNAALSIIGERAEPEERARAVGAGDALRQTTGSDQTAWEQISGQSISHLREQLHQEGLDAAYRQGRTLSFNDVATMAQTMLSEFAETPAASDPPHPHAKKTPLSEREMEVLRLVAEGLSSKVIGKQLFISASTVSYHLTSIFNKLGVDTRAQAVAIAAQQGFL